MNHDNYKFIDRLPVWMCSTSAARGKVIKGKAFHHILLTVLCNWKKGEKKESPVRRGVKSHLCFVLGEMSGHSYRADHKARKKQLSWGTKILPLDSVLSPGGTSNLSSDLSFLCLALRGLIFLSLCLCVWWSSAPLSSGWSSNLTWFTVSSSVLLAVGEREPSLLFLQ